MIDRRLLTGGLVMVVLVVLGARHAMTTPDTPATVNEIATTPAVRVDDPVPIGHAQPATSSTVGEPAVASSSVATTSHPPTTLGSTSTTEVELVDLVDAARPTLPPVEVVDDGHDHTVSVVDVATIASRVVVTAWTWRFDADVDRVEAGLEGHVTADVVAMLTPDRSERARRADASEVAWVIVRNVDIDGAVATATFDHHLVTSTTPETVTARHVAVTVVDNQVVDITEVSD